MNPLRVIIFCTADLGLGSGSEVRARLIAQGLYDLGVKIFVVAGGAPKSFVNDGIGFLLLNPKETWHSTLQKAASEFKPDIIYGITEAGTDVVVNVAKKYNAKIAFDAHAIGIVEIIELGSGYGSRFSRSRQSWKWLRKFRKARFVTVANPTLTSYIKIFNRNSIPIIGMTNTETFNPIGPKHILGDRNRIQLLYAGNFYKWQGVDLLLKAMKIVLGKTKQFELTVIGSVGKDIEKLKGYLSWFSNNDVHFQESVDFEKIADYYRGADILLVPRPFMLSTYLALPQKMSDYMASGKTVIATDIKPHRWAIKNYKTGILCKPDPQAIAEAIISAKEQKMRQEIGFSAREFALKNFDFRIQTKKIFDLFNNI